MKMMSWSRYHCLSWSFLHIRIRPRCGGLTRAGHTVATTDICAPAATKVAVVRRRHHPPAADNVGAGGRAASGVPKPSVPGPSVSNS